MHRHNFTIANRSGDRFAINGAREMNLKSNPIILIWATLLVVLPSMGSALPALEEWNAAARDALPIAVKVWLGLMMLTNIAGLAFIKKHAAARCVFVGSAISYGIGVFLWAQGIPNSFWASVLATHYILDPRCYGAFTSPR